MSAPALAQLVDQWQRHDIWLGTGLADSPTETTGFADLDDALPGRGWPLGALTELLPAADGIGELRLILPTLTRLTQADRRVALINPPFLPYAPAWQQQGMHLRQLTWIRTDSIEDNLWAAQELLRSQQCAAVVCWPGRIDNSGLRKLQLAAETGSALGFVYRAPQVVRDASPAALRLGLEASADGLTIHIHKARGGRNGLRVPCRLPHHPSRPSINHRP